MEPQSPIEELGRKLRKKWPQITGARDRALRKREKLAHELAGYGSADASVVAFGSLARGELTAGSDLDWTLLIDGQADPFHQRTASEISKRLKELGETPPSAGGTFGRLAFSHELIHRIGGDDDSNRNTTQRLLLLLESLSIGPPEAHQRVLKGILTRYLYDDVSFRKAAKGARIPHFLLNDLARYWRTVAVDFAHKQRTRSEGSALRNIKLRFSRKLLYIAGLLTCFSFEIESGASNLDELFASGEVQPLVEWLLPKFQARTPLESVAVAVLAAGDANEDAVKQFFGAYEGFLQILDSPAQRSALSGPKGYDSEEYQVAREQSHRFRDAVRDLFLRRESRIGSLTLDYGVF